MGYKHSESDLLKSGIALFRARGYHAVGINDILSACSIPKGSFYNFYSGKEDFALQASVLYAAWLARETDETDALSHIPAPDRLMEYFWGRRAYYSGTGFSETCLHLVFSSELANNREIMDVILKAHAARITSLAGWISQGISEGSISAAVVPGQASVLLLTAFNGSLMLAKAAGNSGPLDEFIDNTIALVLR